MTTLDAHRPAADPLGAGRRALERGDRGDARAVVERALAPEEGPEALDGLGAACRWPNGGALGPARRATWTGMGTRPRDRRPAPRRAATAGQADHTPPGDPPPTRGVGWTLVELTPTELEAAVGAVGRNLEEGAPLA